MKPLLVVNPQSGGGRAGALFERMRGTIEKAIGEFDVEHTDRSRHAVDLARGAARAGRETVVAVGGDGLIHEVVNGLLLAKHEGASAPKLGILGQGTGGDLRKTLGLEHRLDRYLGAIAAGKTRSIDIGRFTYESHEGEASSAFFVNILSVGLGGLVDRFVATTTKMLGGKAAYFIASARGLLESEVGVVNATITLGGETREERFSTRNLAICNGRYFGGGMHVAPMAEVDDGVFEVIDLGAASKLKFALDSSSIYSGEHLKLPEVKHFRCEKLRLELENKRVNEKFLLDVDGEPLGRLPLDVTIERRAIDVFVP